METVKDPLISILHFWEAQCRQNLTKTLATCNAHIASAIENYRSIQDFLHMIAILRVSTIHKTPQCVFAVLLALVATIRVMGTMS
jgi:hypothetical protein